MIERDNKLAAIENLLNLRLIIVLPALILLSGSVCAQVQWRDAELNWKLKRDRNDVQIYLSKVPESKFRAVFSTMKIAATTSQLAALVMDLDNCPNWASMCKSARVIERISPQETYVHSVNNAPFPVRDRDMVAHVSWRHDPSTGIVTMRSDATPQRLAKKKGVVRVQYASSEWYFIPDGNGNVLVENYAHVDPNGKVPAWLTNLLIVESPYKTLTNMRKLVLNGDYSNAKISFIPDAASQDADSSVEKIPEKVAELDVN